MNIQFNTDKNISGSDALNEKVSEMITKELNRYDHQITRIEVHLSDENSSSKGGGDDKRCMIEARLEGLKPIAASSSAENIEMAVKEALDKLKAAIDTTRGKLSNH